MFSGAQRAGGVTYWIYDALGSVTFSHQDRPHADGHRRHHYRSDACASGGAKIHVAGPLPNSRDQRRQRLAAALTSGADRTLRAGADSWRENLTQG